VLGHVSTGGEHPRHFCLIPGTELLLCANQDSNNILSYHIDANTGLPVATGHELNIRKPVCILPVA
jgi:6-phosphogluconolactonase